MFLVSDGLEERRRKVLRFLDQNEQAIAVLLAAADCERTLRRAILSLGTTPTKELAHRLGRPRPKGYSHPPGRKPPKYGSTIEGYADAWRAEVLAWTHVDLKGGLVSDWDALKNAFQLRHDLVHGDTGTVGQGYARKQSLVILDATASVHNWSLSQGYNLEATLRRRLKPRPAS